MMWHRLLPLAVLLTALILPGAKVVAFPSGDLTLHGVLYEPASHGPFPAILFNQGNAPVMYSSDAIEALGPLFVN